MSIARIFATAFARRLAAVLVALLLGWFGRAHAQSYPDCLDQTKVSYAYGCPDRPSAYAGVKAASIWWATTSYNGVASQLGYGNPSCSNGACIVEFRVTTNTGHTIGALRSWLQVNECPTGSAWDSTTSTCACPAGQIKNAFSGQCQQSCLSRPELSLPQKSSTGQYIPNGSLGCDGGCMYMHYNSADGGATGTFLGDQPDDTCLVLPTCDLPGWYLSPGTGMCQPPKPECMANQTKDPKTGECSDSCPVGMVLSENGECEKGNDTCPAGQVKGPDGSCVSDTCPAGQTKGADGTCKKDGDTDKDEGDDDKYFSGGDNCSAPPQCSGDPILCGQARIQWRIDCNTRKNTNVSGGACAAMPVCTGEKCDALEVAQLIQQWRATCALEKLADGAQGEGEQPDWTKVDGMSQDPGAGENADDTKGVQTKNLSTNDLDSGGWLGGVGSCPALMTGGGGEGIGASFAQVLASPPSWFCNFIGGMAAVIVMLGAVTAGYILSRG